MKSRSAKELEELKSKHTKGYGIIYILYRLGYQVLITQMNKHKHLSKIQDFNVNILLSGRI